MPYLKVGEENSSDISIYYEDRGTGRPIVLIHGWPLSGASWEKQGSALLAAGYRVITYDRRGFGRSSQPSEGYDYDTLAKDTYHLLEALDLKDVALVGFSMGGGEVARYMGKYNEGRVTKVCFMASIAPALRKDGNNPEGVPPEVFEGIKQAIEKDRFAQLEGFLKLFYNKKLVGGTDISDAAIHASFNVGCGSSYIAYLSCVDAWLEDFREDLKQITVPTLVIHGDEDQILPIDATGGRVPALIPGSKLHVVKGGPHGLNWTHATEVNLALLEFLK
ncbi:Pimeloyl-ACP methyl ester carboxylesterase [Bryocella elongata]|uniref:Pimeloyl-ACP methyl ester carboxylesterase n=1 Tax=Bryocella elongata TaxID=863522 RepID=A0A1H6AGL5_9BACT|nr:alpha/beta hydrolase [Bryocella elongata]SEG47532.1 Pimeloyl-ACP methyl ester carboxylesterase [Bryocella elongata]